MIKLLVVMITALVAMGSIGCGTPMKGKKGEDAHTTRERCDKGAAGACLKLARVAAKKVDQLPEAILFSRKSCQHGSVKGCGFLAEMLRKAGDETGAQTAELQACNIDATGCKRTKNNSFQ